MQSSSIDNIDINQIMVKFNDAIAIVFEGKDKHYFNNVFQAHIGETPSLFRFTQFKSHEQNPLTI